VVSPFLLLAWSLRPLWRRVGYCYPVGVLGPDRAR
jgi:hypothetical protein